MFRVVTMFTAVVWFVLHLLFVAAAADPVKAGTAPGERMPDFTLKDLEGNEVSLRDFRGKQAVLLVVGASW